MRVLSSMAALMLLTTPVRAEPLIFEGRVEAFARAEISSQLNGVIAGVLFRGGEHVMAGDVLIRMDPDDADLALAEAKAQLVRAAADLAQARQEASRLETLGARGIAPKAQVQAAQQGLRAAEAELAIAEVGARRAELDNARTTIEAAISGVISRPKVAVGTYVEAESGAPLGEIVRLDPALVAYSVPYATRLQTMRTTGAETLEGMFDKLRLTIILPDGSEYPHQAQPDFASATVNPEDGTLTVWATVKNLGAVLRPGLAVTVISEILSDQEATQ